MADTLGSLLDEAKRTITGERQDQYGVPKPPSLPGTGRGIL